MDVIVQPGGASPSDLADATPAAPPAVPAYLLQVYWWAYIHPRGIRVFDRRWVTNAILWGNFPRLRDAAIAALGTPVVGRTLQIACVYGGFTQALLRAMAPAARLDVVDVVADQLRNLAGKLAADDPVTLHRTDAADLPFAGGLFDQVVLFFLLHEQPEEVRRRSLAEAWRILRPGGRLVIVDYHRPAWWHPLRYLFVPVLRRLEPFALDLWLRALPSWLPEEARDAPRQEARFFGGLYQMLVLAR